MITNAFTVDSTIPAPSASSATSSTSSSSSSAATLHTAGDQDKKAANSIRGTNKYHHQNVQYPIF